MATSTSIYKMGALYKNPETPKAKPRRASAKPPARLGILGQIETVCKPENFLGAILGTSFGGFVPVATYTLCHVEIAGHPVMQADHSIAWGIVWLCCLVAGGAVYSVHTVTQWGKVGFRHWDKAVGFVVIMEGVMMTASTQPLRRTALAFLIIINAFATAYNFIAEEGRGN